MGNEASHTKEYTVSKECFGTASEWVLYEGRRNISKPIGQPTEDKDAEMLDDIAGNVVTVFVGMPGDKRGKMSLLHNNVKTLMTLRHPDLLRFLSWRETSSRLELVTEHVRPLAEVRGGLTELDISGGLLAVLRAVTFLHQQAGLCHNNVSQAAVFVTSSGGWRLGGAEFACRFSEATPERLQETAAHRYQPALAPEETDTGGRQEWRQSRPWCRDVYAYGVVVEELIGPCLQSEFPGARHFRDEVKRRLLSRDPLARPSLDELQGHDFFSNEFNQIHHFLENLVLKSQEERKVFFIDLASRLRAYPEQLVASRLSALGLSRLVLLDADACRHFLPRLLSPRFDQYASGECVLSPAVFRRFIVPQLLRIFHVHDAHIRLVLLQHFSKYVAEIPRHLLAEVILPELLLGIRDTHDQLVAATLRALADLVPILGAHVVIGSHRHKHFGNGTPKASSGAGVTSVVRRKRVPLSQRHAEIPERRRTLLELSEAAAAAAGSDCLPERRSPEGGEELLQEPALSSPPAADSDGEQAWSDWEAADAEPVPLAPAPLDQLASTPPGQLAPTPPGQLTPTQLDQFALTPPELSVEAAAHAPGVGVLKLSGRAPPPAADEFDRFSIQVRRREPQPERDLFADMEPVIRSGRVTLPELAREPQPQPEPEPRPVSKLDMSFRPTDSDLADAGWDDSDWGDQF